MSKLGQIIFRSEEPLKPSEVSITWEKEGLSGVVYKYRDGFADLDGQSRLFQGRTQLFTEAIASGNASLLLRSVRTLDSGTYSCTVQAPNGGGSVTIHLKTAAFSAPVFTNKEDILTAEAPRWFPKPDVMWHDHNGNIMNASTNFSRNSAGIFYVVSAVQSVTIPNSYSCTIRNNLVVAVADATITESGVSGRTFFTFSAAPVILTFTHLKMMTTVLLAIYYMI
ncbi:V-set domain-containing T-cell activation inhibitor 1 [Lampris incognitus]|uniref:V-set domain-containing T-cell activation inhibitor 1 n=1 Tax=Lampris incognitus TaxID=2546036 RepID=UPI0024B4E7ED|nr:V-set domain-containing T-cell activation inhibitor 1 [Lampris incognitus]